MGREEEKGRETLMCKRNINKLALAHPLLGAWPSSQACALTGNWTENLFGLQDNKGFQDDTQTTELHQSGPYRSFTNKIWYPRITAYCELCHLYLIHQKQTNTTHPQPELPELCSAIAIKQFLFIQQIFESLLSAGTGEQEGARHPPFPWEAYCLMENMNKHRIFRTSMGSYAWGILGQNSDVWSRGEVVFRNRTAMCKGR